MPEGNKPLRYPADWTVRRTAGEPISVVTAYDATMAALVGASSVDALMVGDSLGMTVQGHSSTLPVTLDEMVYHSRLVRRGAPGRFIIGDLPFGSYQADVALGSAAGIRLMKESGVDAVKLEGATPHNINVIQRLVAAGVPVMGHIGLTPQSFLTLGGFRVQGRTPQGVALLVESARTLEGAGCFAIVLELVTAETAGLITDTLEIPTIGIGSGARCSGQVLVFHDLLGLQPSVRPRHAKRYADVGTDILAALNSFDREVKSGDFPTTEQAFS